MSNAMFVLLPFVFVLSCRPDSLVLEEFDNDQPAYPAVDERLWTYFDGFEKEALARGYSVDLSRANITGELIKIHDDGVAGSCSYGGRQRSKAVTIDTDFWDRASTAYREYIVFHELGHCYLFRDHLEDCLESGIWASIMRSGTLNFCRDFYNTRTRAYYLDELFEGKGD